MALAYTQKTGLVAEDDPEEITICPKCGTPLPPGTTQCVQCMKKGKALVRLLQFCGRHKKIIFAAGAYLAAQRDFVYYRAFSTESIY